MAAYILVVFRFVNHRLKLYIVSYLVVLSYGHHTNSWSIAETYIEIYLFIHIIYTMSIKGYHQNKNIINVKTVTKLFLHPGQDSKKFLIWMSNKALSPPSTLTVKASLIYFYIRRNPHPLRAKVKLSLIKPKHEALS